MDGINLTNGDSIKPTMLSTEQLESISDFKNKLENDGVISKKDVLSIEEFLGVNIITSKINSKKLTAHPTTTMLEETIEVVSEYSNEYKPVTNYMVLDKAKFTLLNLRRLKNSLINLSNTTNSDFYDKALSDEYALYMDQDKLINLSDEPLDKICTNHFNYLSSITDTEKASYLIDTFNDGNVLPTGLMVLLNDKILENVYFTPRIETISVVTIRKVIDAFRNGSVIPAIDKLIEIVSNDINLLINDKSWHTYSGKELAHTYKRYNSICDLLCDKLTIYTLSFLNNPKN